MAPRKKDHLVETALALFAADGFHGVGIDRILEEAGVAKMTLYNNFASKDELIAAALERHHADFMLWFDERLEAIAPDLADRALGAFDVLAEWLEDPGFRGCPMIKAASEYSAQDHPFHKAALAFKRDVFVRFRQYAEAAGAADPVAAAGALFMLFEGATVVAQVTGDASAAPRARIAASALL